MGGGTKNEEARTMGSWSGPRAAATERLLCHVAAYARRQHRPPPVGATTA